MDARNESKRKQVCALFNARANVGEARFVCPLCRLRNVVTDKPRPRPPEKEKKKSAAEVGIDE